MHYVCVIWITGKGYDFDVHEGKETFFGIIAVISADNTASNSLGGYKESVASYRVCWKCK